MKLQVIVNDELLKKIDDVCVQQGYDRSEFVRNCIRSEIFSITDPVTHKVDKPMLVTEMPKEVIKEAKKLGKIFTATVGDRQDVVAMGIPGPTATGFDGGEGINPNWKTIWVGGRKHWVDEFGNDKGEVK